MELVFVKPPFCDPYRKGGAVAASRHVVTRRNGEVGARVIFEATVF